MKRWATEQNSSCRQRGPRGSPQWPRGQQIGPINSLCCPPGSLVLMRQVSMVTAHSVCDVGCFTHHSASKHDRTRYISHQPINPAFEKSGSALGFSDFDTFPSYMQPYKDNNNNNNKWKKAECQRSSVYRCTVA